MQDIPGHTHTRGNEMQSAFTGHRESRRAGDADLPRSQKSRWKEEMADTCTPDGYSEVMEIMLSRSLRSFPVAFL
ncbi:hypothetical protein [Microbulbifer sediminum]|uniref:hypothetical protein n=1 Tax=Microbulbifer sediminum TaxID=2904250 RepID=UPI001F453077|nr:hypothetical protein [Microbulbifer sediminum]